MSSQPSRRRQKTSATSRVDVGNDAAQQPDSAADNAGRDAARLEHELAVLRAIPRCSGVGESKYTGPVLNKMDVHARLDGAMIRRPGSGIFDDKLKMALDVRRQVTEVVGPAAVHLAEMAVLRAARETTTSSSEAAAALELTQIELEWLHRWAGEQAEPLSITQEQADAAVIEYRKKKSGAAVPTTYAFARMKATQMQKAKVAAAQLRQSKANSELKRAIESLPGTGSSAQVSEALDHKRTTLGGINPPNWELFNNYSREKYQELEVKEQDRRALQPRGDLRVLMPRGDDSRGWFMHWRRGIHGALCSWAQGSLIAIVYMLARSAERFGVADEVAKELGCLPKKDTERAQTCMYICSRLQNAVAVLKYCKSEDQRVDYHNILGACAPRRTKEDDDPDSMYYRVAMELNVTPYSRCVQARSPLAHSTEVAHTVTVVVPSRQVGQGQKAV